MKIGEVLNGLIGAAKASDQWLDNEGGFIANGISYMLPGYGDFRAITDVFDDVKAGDYGDAAVDTVLAGLGLIPLVGDAASAVGKIAKAGAKTAMRGAKATGRTAKAMNPALENLSNIASMKQLRNQARAAGTEADAAKEARGFLGTMAENSALRRGRDLDKDLIPQAKAKIADVDKTISDIEKATASVSRAGKSEKQARTAYKQALQEADAAYGTKFSDIINLEKPWDNIGQIEKQLGDLFPNGAMDQDAILKHFFEDTRMVDPTELPGIMAKVQGDGTPLGKIIAALQPYLKSSKELAVANMGRNKLGKAPEKLSMDKVMEELRKEQPYTRDLRNWIWDMLGNIEDLWGSTSKWGGRALVGGRAALLSLLNDPRLMTKTEQEA